MGAPIIPGPLYIIPPETSLVMFDFKPLEWLCIGRWQSLCGFPPSRGTEGGGSRVRAWGQLLRHHNSLFHQDFFCPIISGAHMPKPLDSWHQRWAIAANFYARDCPQATGNGGWETRAELQSFLSTSSPTATSGHFSRHPDFSRLPPTYTPNEDKLLSPNDKPQFCVVTIVLSF